MKFKRMAEVELRGKRVFIRADLNVPCEGGRITDDTRIRASVPAIELALKEGAKVVMVTSHLGRPKEGLFSQDDSLAPIAKRLSELLEREVPLIRDWIQTAPQGSGVLLLENCRFNKGEKADDEALAKKIATLCDVDQSVLDQRIADYEKLSGKKVGAANDMRKVLDDQSIDVDRAAPPGSGGRETERAHDRLPQLLCPSVPERHRPGGAQRRQVHGLRRRP